MAQIEQLKTNFELKMEEAKADARSLMETKKDSEDKESKKPEEKINK